MLIFSANASNILIFTILNVKNEDKTKGREDEYHFVKLLLIASLGIIKNMIKF